MSKDHLHPDNCNKAKCKTCIFGNTPLDISPERMDEIRLYLVKGEASHICHTTNKTCRGALEFQASAFFAIGIIPANTVQSLLETAARHLKF